MLAVTVKGGTNAGCRPPLRDRPTQAWTCPNGHQNRGFATRCLTAGCNRKRP